MLEISVIIPGIIPLSASKIKVSSKNMCSKFDTPSLSHSLSLSLLVQFSPFSPLSAKYKNKIIFKNLTRDREMTIHFSKDSSYSLHDLEQLLQSDLKFSQRKKKETPRFITKSTFILK